MCVIFTSQELLENGFDIAIADEITLYDALFVAASERKDTPFDIG